MTIKSLASMMLRTTLWSTIIVALGACAGGMVEEDAVPSPQDEPKPVNPQGTQCLALAITQPLEGAFINGSVVTIQGVTGETNQTSLTVDGTDVDIEGGRFEIVLEKPDGSHQIEVVCDRSRAVRTITVSSEIPRISVDTPASGALLQEGAGPVEVRGRVQNPRALVGLRLNGEALMVDATGAFTARYRPTAGMNHLELVAETVTGELVDLNRSFLYGHFTAWEDDRSALVVADVRSMALKEVSHAIERRLTSDELERMIDPHMGRNGSMELHEIEYDRLKLDIELRDRRLGVRLRLHDFGLKFTYHYSVLGIGGRIRGWARCHPLEVRAEIVLDMTANGGYDLRIENPNVELHDFDLDLNDFYSIVEGLIQPMVRDMGRDTLVDALRSIVVEDLVNANLLEQEIEILGQRTRLNLTVEELSVDPNGIHGASHAKLEPFAIVNNAPGFWTSSPSPMGGSGQSDLALGMSIDLFNRILGEAWRGGLMDLDVAALVGDTSSLSAGLLAGVVGPDLLERFDAGAAVQLTSKALMQPIVRIQNPDTGELVVQMGALQVTMSSETPQGQLLEWATIEVAADFTIHPKFDNGEFTLDASLKTRIEVAESPLFPIQETSFESFLETLLDGVSASTLSSLVDNSFRFGDINILGIGVGSVKFGGSFADPGFLILGIDLAEVN